tara:strand:+ start:896 stop:2014 length:1119 start_codon:yes stop_codon:yes gene_type:complete
MKILITNCLLRKTFDILNIVKIHFRDNDIIYTADEYLIQIKLIYGKVNFHKLSEDNFNKDLNIISEKYKNESIIYLPIEEEITVKFYNFIKIFGNKNFKYKLPEISKYNLSRNKNELNIFCEINKIPCPKYYSETDIKQKNYTLPLILKPINGSGSKGIKYINSESDLIFESINFKKYFLQELLNNPKEVQAGFFLCDKGKILSFYSHKRIRTFPEHGGVSVLSKSNCNQKIRNAGEKIIKKLNWSGLIMIEFLEDFDTKEFKIIEINPRLWGSILLSEFNNSCFIHSYLKLCMGKSVKKQKVLVNKKIRWIFPYDIIYFFKNPQNPFKFFTKDENTCYINFTYSSFCKSFIFILLTYFDYKKVKQKLLSGK